MELTIELESEKRKKDTDNCLLKARHYPKKFTCINSFNYYNSHK